MGLWWAGVPWSISRVWGAKLVAQEKAVSRSLPVQGSQPSTASPFKQDMFVYSASPGSDSPSAGAPATPVIMSRSPTGGSRRAGTGSALTPTAPGSTRGLAVGVGMGSAALGWRSLYPSLAQAAKGDGLKQWLRVSWQEGHPTGCGASPPSSQNPDPEGAVLERHPQVLYFCISMGRLFLFYMRAQRWLWLWLCSSLLP